jgi:hypothetical protein
MSYASATTVQSGRSAVQFFGTTELLEQVLLNIGTFKELMKLRRVCRKWRDVIEDTASLRPIMFLASQPLDHEWYFLGGSNLLVKGEKGSVTNEHTKIVSSARINPMLFYKKPEHARAPIWAKNSLRFDLPSSWTSQELYVRMEGKPLHVKTKSPISSMFATQPPLTVMSLRTYDSGHRRVAREIRNPKGLKVIDVLRAVKQLSGQKAIVLDRIFFPQDDDQTLTVEVHIDEFPLNKANLKPGYYSRK